MGYKKTNKEWSKQYYKKESKSSVSNGNSSENMDTKFEFQ